MSSSAMTASPQPGSTLRCAASIAVDTTCSRSADAPGRAARAAVRRRASATTCSIASTPTGCPLPASMSTSSSRRSRGVAGARTPSPSSTAPRRSMPRCCWTGVEPGDEVHRAGAHLRGDRERGRRMPAPCRISSTSTRTRWASIRPRSTHISARSRCGATATASTAQTGRRIARRRAGAYLRPPGRHGRAAARSRRSTACASSRTRPSRSARRYHGRACGTFGAFAPCSASTATRSSPPAAAA